MSRKRDPLLPALLADVAAFCHARHGRVSELAAALDVAQPQVSRWLAGRAEPSGEAVLQLQAWLARQRFAEAQRHHAADPKGRLPLRRLPSRSGS
jgi:transcriptional regulator with XRE-family HTH domain